MNGQHTDILLVESNGDHARLVRRLLSRRGGNGYSLRHVSRLADALVEIGRDAADVVLLDPALPDGQGLHTVVRMHQHAPSIPIVVLTTGCDHAHMVAFLRSGAQDYVFKDEADGETLWRAMRHAIARKNLEDALRQSRERLALVIRGSTDGVWDWNIDTGEVFYSPRWKSMLGYDDREIGCSLDEWKTRLHPEDRPRALGTVQAYLAGRIPSYEIEHRLRHRDGTYRWVLARGVALRDPAGKAYRMAGTHVDLTERKCKEEELQQTNEALKESHENLLTAQMRLIQAEKMQSIGQLSAGIAHEVKNPLATIIMGLEFLKNCAPAAGNGVATVLEEMSGAVQRAGQIVKGLLDYSAPLTLQSEPQDLNRIVKRALMLVRHELTKNHIHVELHLHKQLPSLDLDRNKITQALLNLYTNAAHAMPAGGVLTVTTYEAPLASFHTGEEAPETNGNATARSVVALDVEDSGPGIPDEQLERVFDVFYTTKPTGVGSGLGLAVTKGIIELHGGGITISNRQEGGTKAAIRFLV